MQRERKSTDSSESEPMLIMSSIERRRRLNFRIVRSGPESESGAMIAFTRDPSEARVDHRRRLVDASPDLRHDLVDDAAQVRLVVKLPSGRRASTIGDDSSMRRPICDTILLMMRRRCDSSVKRTVVS